MDVGETVSEEGWMDRGGGETVWGGREGGKDGCRGKV